MKLRLKPLSEQVIVLTGASSGIGLATARMAAHRKAKLVLVARSEAALSQLVDEITQSGGEAIHVTADVGNELDMRRVADAALQRFGRFDTWINDAGVSIYGPLRETALDDARRLFDTNFWGMVHGSLIAVEHLRTHGGAIINLGSIVSDRAIPLQGMYCASKHAVKGFTDTLRMELEKEGVPVAVTLVKPSAIDTPFTRHAKNNMAVEPDFPPPVYAPQLVAESILHCAQRPVRDLTVGGGGKAIALTGTYAPRLTDRYMELTMFDQQQKEQPARPRSQHTLYKPSEDLAERGEYDGHVRRTSLYTRARRSPGVTSALMLGAASLALATLMRSDT